MAVAHQKRAAMVLGAVCLGAFVLQTVHMVEHILQILQKYVWDVPAHGLLGEVLDREWVHLGYNASLEAALLVVFFGYRLYRPEGSGGRWVPGQYVFAGVLLLQGYHVFEHVVKVAQYLATGVEDTPGILGQFLPTILVHFTLNAIVLVLMSVAYYLLGLTHRAWDGLHGRGTATEISIRGRRTESGREVA